MELLKGKMHKTMGLLTLLSVLALPMFSFADSSAHDMSAVTEAFTGLSSSLMGVLTSVGTIAVGIMAVFLGWKYGRKLFNQVAK